ncbi:nitroreductase family protein [Salinicoccus roseus]|uniref:nitroreductase family protein n=1 Tax=Salinicoccus roseus TaxID=45670 RepID=UPI00352590AB
MKKKLRQIKKSISEIDNKIIKICYNNTLLTSIYYFIKPSFWREEKAVLYGRYQYQKNSSASIGNIFFLRRSIHRLEKGILMRPRREVFAESYIYDTVNSYLKLKEDGGGWSTVDWAHDVLTNYFEVVNSAKSSKIKLAESKFNEFSFHPLRKKMMIPYNRDNKDKPNISIEEFEKLAIYRRSVRWFLEKPIKRSIIEKAVHVAGYSPSACNRIPYKFRVFDDFDKVKEIANCAMGTAGYLDNIPSIIAVVGDLSAYPNERDRHLIYIDSSLATMSFVYALELQGVSSCIINWPDIEKREKQISKILSLKPYERVTMLIAVGYEDNKGMVAFSKKKEITEMVSYNQ